jgi:caffeoyl-CoA O-methyltransferase
MPISDEVRERALQYNRDLFAPEDDALTRLLAAAEAEKLPQIQITSDVGRLLQILTASVGATRALEIGTLGGYSGTWIARGLAPGGRLISLEIEAKHKTFAERWFGETGVADRVEVRLGPALETLRDFSPDEPFDFVFIDADKDAYPDYLAACKPLLRVGGILAVDNVMFHGGDITDPEFDNPSINGIRAFNEALAADDDFTAIIMPLRGGVAVAHRRA